MRGQYVRNQRGRAAPVAAAAVVAVVEAAVGSKERKRNLKRKRTRRFPELGILLCDIHIK